MNDLLKRHVTVRRHLPDESIRGYGSWSVMTGIVRGMASQGARRSSAQSASFALLLEVLENSEGIPPGRLVVVDVVESEVTVLPEPQPAARLGSAQDESTWVPWPDDQPRRKNHSGEPCNMWTGPCACGSWHEGGE